MAQNTATASSGIVPLQFNNSRFTSNSGGLNFKFYTKTLYDGNNSSNDLKQVINKVPGAIYGADVWYLEVRCTAQDINTLALVITFDDNEITKEFVLDTSGLSDLLLAVQSEEQSS